MLARLLIASLLSLGVFSSARADFTEAIDLSGNAQGALGQSANTTIGYSFVVGNAPITIYELGLDAGTGNINPAFGFSLPVSVHVWSASTQVDVAQALLNATNALSSDGRYFYTAITPVTLAANTTYDIGADLPYSNQGSMFGGTVVKASSIASVSGPISGVAGTNPTTDAKNLGAGLGPLLGPTFAIGVPEPASMALLGLGVVGTLAWCVRRSRA